MTRRDAVILGLAIPAVWAGERIARAQGLGDFMTSGGAPSCSGARTPTPATKETFYKPNAPERRSLRGLETAGTPLRLTGFVIGLRCGVIKDARMEFWQADARGVYDMTGFALRGSERTTDTGAYSLETIVPGAAAGRARRVHVRVTPPGHAALSTELFFPDDAARTSDPDFRPELVMKRVAGGAGQVATFDVVFDL